MKLHEGQLIHIADDLAAANKRWRVIDQSGGDNFVIRLPDAADGDRPSPAQGETMRFWRFKGRAAAERFRHRQLLNELPSLDAVLEGR